MNTTQPQLTKVSPPASFLTIFETLTEEQKNVVITFLYQSVKEVYHENDSHRLIQGVRGKYQNIITQRDKSIDIPFDQDPAEVIMTDERILFGVTPTDPYFYPGKMITRNGQDQYFYDILEIYIDSSIIDKRAILRYLFEYQDTSQTARLTS